MKVLHIVHTNKHTNAKTAHGPYCARFIQKTIMGDEKKWLVNETPSYRTNSSVRLLLTPVALRKSTKRIIWDMKQSFYHKIISIRCKRAITLLSIYLDTFRSQKELCHLNQFFIFFYFHWMNDDEHTRKYLLHTATDIEQYGGNFFLDYNGTLRCWARAH